ncbi:hypothetical protein BDV98DRAFT_111470 [Pterulicium gracile]|uniref:Uncharacterized protein n=1 Tax=Pterulicium gracile TaxID=1884261 RepID=A0A5C3QE03_9AGAR|nr:hypothetical protein BDV98DRAFT_111470 [Pterula gracilis]
MYLHPCRHFPPPSPSASILFSAAHHVQRSKAYLSIAVHAHNATLRSRLHMMRTRWARSVVPVSRLLGVGTLLDARCSAEFIRKRFGGNERCWDCSGEKYCRERDRTAIRR